MVNKLASSDTKIFHELSASTYYVNIALFQAAITTASGTRSVASCISIRRSASRSNAAGSMDLPRAKHTPGWCPSETKTIAMHVRIGVSGRQGKFSDKVREM